MPTTSLAYSTMQIPMNSASVAMLYIYTRSAVHILIHYTALSDSISALCIHVAALYRTSMLFMHVCYSYMYNAYGTYTRLCINRIEGTILYVSCRNIIATSTI